MAQQLCTCDTCGDPFMALSANANDCGNQRRHAELKSPKRRADDKKDKGAGGKK